jgi:hypothetical protein
MRDLLRSTDGEIDRQTFRKGVGFLFLLTVSVSVLLYAIRQLSIIMQWMTVAIAPFFGLVVIVAVCSLIYFWYCVFIKRLRALGQGTLLLNVWLIAMFFAAATRLVDYQNRTLDLAQSGPLIWTGFIAIMLAVLAIFLFLVLLFRGWNSADR